MIILTLIMQAAAGILGSNLASRMSPRSGSGALVNFLTGAAGGVAGGQLLSLLGVHIFIADSNMDLTGTIINILGSGFAGGVMLNLFTALRDFFSQR